ncbi:pro-sigmaK processing inhibitor BofA family protein [Selenomonas flueggei]|uniref:Pro-sigmaK processing inhibitor BofA n=1 Tax=Selenomonas flueggei ATCC 43531 TaxID=638302 RepID=C4V118_9FIRM|nr:pro-sigmaK processing inhibitor BofA family protein [Selenomonas flueggei]EEQ49354.1 pro-sigmaK processing inhibitor BofA [Selenomonas flueggei ATCC 43531]
MDIVAGTAVAVLIFAVLGKVISLPFRIVWKLITNSVVGAIILWVVNLFGAGIEITFLRALIAGFFGIPGVVVLLIARLAGH